MIVVFVVDTSPSMSRPVSGDSGMSRLDLAKMAVEDLSRRLRKGGVEHNSNFVVDSGSKGGGGGGIGSGGGGTNATQRSISNIGQGASRQDALLLLSTSRQHPDTANVRPVSKSSRYFCHEFVVGMSSDRSLLFCCLCFVLLHQSALLVAGYWLGSAEIRRQRHLNLLIRIPIFTSRVSNAN